MEAARNYGDRVRFVLAVLPFAPPQLRLWGVKGEPHIIAGCSTDWKREYDLWYKDIEKESYLICFRLVYSFFHKGVLYLFAYHYSLRYIVLF